MAGQAVPPAFAQSRASARQGKFSVSGGENVSGPQDSKSSRSTGEGIRSG